MDNCFILGMTLFLRVSNDGQEIKKYGRSSGADIREGGRGQPCFGRILLLGLTVGCRIPL